MSDLRTAAKEALWAFQYHVEQTWPTDRSTAAITALRAALAQQDAPVEEHKHWCASLTQLLLSDPPKRAPCDCKKKQAEPVEPVAWECKAGGLKPLTQRQYDAQTAATKRHYTRIAPPQRKPLTEEVAALTAQRDALLEALRALVRNEGLDPYSYLDKGIGTATAAGQRWLNARAAIKAVEGEKT